MGARMKYGCIKSKKDLRNYKICKMVNIELPDTFELKHTHIKNQGNIESCVAHSISEVLEYNDNINYSTGWIYGYRPDNYYQGKGMSINNAIGTIYKVGYIKNKDLDVNVEMREAKDIVDKDLEKYKYLASGNKIKSYAYLHNYDEVKEALYLGKVPVVLSIDIDKGGLKLDKNYVARVYKTPYGGHAVVCYGWNETGLLIQNSWGEEWGNKGCFILPYEYPFDEAWAITFKEQHTDLDIEKPKVYWLRELIMKIIKLIRKIRKERK